MADTTIIIGRKKGWMTTSSLMPPTTPVVDDGYKDIKELLDSAGRKDNLDLLEECRNMFAALQNFRDKRERCWRYSTGDQWGDIITDPDNPHRKMTEGEYIKSQGKVPLKNNVITPLVKSTLGIYRGNKKEPMAICRDRDEAKLGDMMSIALQYAYQVNDVDELNARGLQESLNSAMYLSSVNYEWNDKRKMYEIFIKNEDQSRVFFNGDVDDVRFNDLTTIGFIRDMQLDALVQKFANSLSEAQRIREYYRNVIGNIANYMESLNTKKNVADFYCPQNTNMCRLIEVWRKETKERLRCHDTLNAEAFICELTDQGEIDRINEERKAQYVAQGMTEEDAPLIVYEWYIDRYWYVRYMTPLGDIIQEKRSPFMHGSHPYVVSCYPMINSETHSFVEDVIDQQRYINRYVTMMDAIVGASAKGTLLVPDGAIPDNMTLHDLVREWSRPDSAIMYKWKPGMPLPQQVSSPGIQPGHVQMFDIQMKMMEDISGVHAAMQGQTASASTPASLYAQQAQNSSNNLTDFISWYDRCVAERDYKMMKTIQQYYNQPRYLAIAGHDYDEESKWYTPERIKDSEFDITINEATATPAYRNVLNDFLMQMLQSGAIDTKMFLENVNMPFAPRLLEAVKKKEEEMMQQQQAMQQQAMNAPQAAMPTQAEGTQQTGGGIATQQQAMDTINAINSPEALSLVNASMERQNSLPNA